MYLCIFSFFYSCHPFARIFINKDGDFSQRMTSVSNDYSFSNIVSIWLFFQCFISVPNFFGTFSMKSARSDGKGIFEVFYLR